MKWEYKSVVTKANRALSDDVLNRYGIEGWELVSICPSPNGSTILYVFKRSVTDN